MGCKRKPCKPKKSNKIENPSKDIKWLDYKSPDENGFGYGKFCYFISCPDSKFPIRDYVYEGKLEPHYEEKSYNGYAFCNQKGIRNLKKNKVSCIVFVTKYQGTITKYQCEFYITGWFPLYKWKKIDNLHPKDWKRNKKEEVIYKTRIAYKSDAPIFLSIEDSIKLDDEKWKEWFRKDLPKNRNLRPPKPQLNYFTQKLDSPVLEEIKRHFEKHRENNKIDDYINEIRSYYEAEENL